MNEVFRAAAESARLGWIMGLLTVLFLAVFLYWTWWAYRAGNRARLDEASRMPFTDGGEQ
ncbi:MAG TPA: CcoQ/FixQ family Cbb3-type cytochrome c oxidase assembly chaperone [Gemmatimonadales bacterium]|jgi:cbb3-type cytochrome oxidase subunit 3|nr:CcoQ/FixQ family Cbb3-type cytochrome c oxidase assembly chaperone [Gemmatimonadales bacterium]